MLDYYQAIASLLPVLVLAGVVEFAARIRRLELQSTGGVWTSLVLYLVFFAAAITGETLALNAVAHGSASEIEEDLIDAALIFSVAILIAGGLIEHVDVLEERTQLPIWPVFVAGWAVMVIGANLAVALT
jgi:hypothetical protein